MSSDFVARVSDRLVRDEPMSAGPRLAAVSVILKERANPRILLIRRAEHPGDPWSGQIAFPGGKALPEDGSARGTAVRETLEEVGVDLTESAEFLGHAQPLRTHTGTMEVVPCVFLLRRDVTVVTNGEVASYRWVELGPLLSPESVGTFDLDVQGNRVEMPAFIDGDYRVWGLTHRLISSLFL